MPQSGDLRLVGGESWTAGSFLWNGGCSGEDVTFASGRLQIFHNGTWGTVCDDLWTAENSAVACAQLGFDQAVGTTTETSSPSTPGCFGVGNGSVPVLVDDVVCNGTEASLPDCGTDGKVQTGDAQHWWGNYPPEGCNYGEDIGLVCCADCSAFDVEHLALDERCGLVFAVEASAVRLLCDSG
jgi:hypothetical protein